MVETKEGGDSPRAYTASRDRPGRPACFQLAAAAVLTREFVNPNILSQHQSSILIKDPHPCIADYNTSNLSKAHEKRESL